MLSFNWNGMIKMGKYSKMVKQQPHRTLPHVLDQQTISNSETAILAHISCALKLKD